MKRVSMYVLEPERGATSASFAVPRPRSAWKRPMLASWSVGPTAAAAVLGNSSKAPVSPPAHRSRGLVRRQDEP